MIEARDEKYLQRFQTLLASYEFLIVVELGFVALSKTGSELLFETARSEIQLVASIVAVSGVQTSALVVGPERVCSTCAMGPATGSVGRNTENTVPVGEETELLRTCINPPCL